MAYLCCLSCFHIPKLMSFLETECPKCGGRLIIEDAESDEEDDHEEENETEDDETED